jgi:hypothetical protein
MAVHWCGLSLVCIRECQCKSDFRLKLCSQVSNHNPGKLPAWSSQPKSCRMIRCEGSHQADVEGETQQIEDGNQRPCCMPARYTETDELWAHSPRAPGVPFPPKCWLCLSASSSALTFGLYNLTLAPRFELEWSTYLLQPSFWFKLYSSVPGQRHKVTSFLFV